MRLREIDPYVRFAASVRNGCIDAPIKVTDCRIFYAEEGNARIHIDGKRYDLVKGGLFYCCGGSVYRVENHTDLNLICINFDLTREFEKDTMPYPVSHRREQWDTMPVHRETVEDSFFLNTHLLVENASRWYESIKELTRVREDHTSLSGLLCGSLLKALLLRLHQAEKLELPPKLRLVQDYIRSNYKENITNRQLGELTGYHEYYLNRMFRTYTGMNLHSFLVKVRMEQAAYLILNTELPLSTVAEEVGIRSYPHFSSCFKSHYGCSPVRFGQHGR